MVTAITSEQTELSVKISPTGWAWMVYNRRLLVWMYKTTLPGKVSQCTGIVCVVGGCNLKVASSSQVVMDPVPNERNLAVDSWHFVE